MEPAYPVNAGCPLSSRANLEAATFTPVVAAVRPWMTPARAGARVRACEVAVCAGEVRIFHDHGLRRTDVSRLSETETLLVHDVRAHLVPPARCALTHI
jgi:hypothetical protein